MRSAPIIFLALLLIGGCAANHERMFHDLQKLAEQGSPEAQYHLGMFYHTGTGTQVDKKKAFEWFSRSARNSDPLGHYKMGCYYDGQGEAIVPADPRLALQHKLFAAKAGYALAQSDVAAKYYENGQIDEAIEWWVKAANQGDPQSFYSLYAVYYERRSDSGDRERAYRYLSIIEKNSDESQKSEIQQKLAELKAGLSQAQILASDTWTKQWKSERSELTVRALSGLDDTRRVIEAAANT